MEALVNWLTNWLTSESGEESVVKHRRNGSPYVNPNELVKKAGTEAILGDVGKSLDELEQKKKKEKC